ncbi:pyridoxal phosphate phosphatase PHOSPHO2 isoform X1 [Colossoma macropomum]|uniref:pyridoxal phosphate phosphatase PHOSPHO2 isoform X1 n=2 Tax=Colossoma macropomum TaxID=42526 RepID=UPI001864F6C9|nr:pyridoxal phosphate phosphatase PHOSPHO2 isoform X1 [Colossoma macropomum]
MLAKMKTLVVFDFDHTLVDDNSDTWVVRCAPEQSLPAWLKASYEKGRWTEYMGRVLSYLRDQSIYPDTIRSVLETIPFTDGMVELLTFISQNKHDIDCIIVSDSNTLFIDWILEVHGVKGAVDSVFTNPASIDNGGYIGVQCFHSHQCENCPVNLCKQKVLSDFRESQANSGVHYQAICYVGDGGNDFCPIKVLEENDLVMPRKGYTLEKLLSKARRENNALKPQIAPWSSGSEIQHQLLDLIQQ